GYLEETYFTFSYSPVRDDSGEVGGVFCAMTETTGRIIGERRLQTLQELAAKTAEAKTVEEVCHIATTTLSINPHDIPFALLYRVEPDGKQACLTGTTGIEAGTVASPVQVDLCQESELNGSDEAFRWNLSKVNRTGKAELVSNLPTKLGGLPKGPGLEEATEALVIPISQLGKAQRSGLLVLGISPRREFDDDYQSFFELIASHVATAIANADAVEEASCWLSEEGSGEWGIGNGEDRCTPTLESGAGTEAPLLLPSPARILLVDDNVDTRDYVRRLLSRDYEVEAVSDRLAVLDAVKQHLPDLVLTDMMTLGLDGIEVLRSLRNDPSTQNIPIILLSARAEEELGIEELEAGADDYLVKPFSGRELRARVRTNLELARLRRETVHYQEQLRVEAQAAQKQVSNILESITDAFVAFDREWRYIYVNEYATQLLRKKREELLGKHVWTDVFPELVGTQCYGEYHRAVAEQVPIIFEKFSELLGIWIEVNAYPTPDGLAVYFRDITHRKRAEQALRESEERFRQLTENIGTVFFMSESFSETSPGQIAYVSPAYERIWGRSCESLYLNTRSWFEAVHPDDRERIGQALPGIAKAEFDVEFRIVRPDGEVRWVHDRVFPIYNERGEIYRTAGIVEDITERKQIEEALQQQEAQLRLITNTVPVLISFVDAQQRYRFNNRTYEEWFGHPATEVYGKPIREVLGEAAYEAVLPYVEQVLAGQPITFESEIPYQEGGIRYVSATYVPRFDCQGNVEGYVGLVSDISERKQAEIALQKSEEQARLAIQVGRLGTWRYNLDTDLVELDKRMQEIWGEPDDAERIPLPRVIERIHPEDRERVATAISTALDSGSSGTYEIDYRIAWDDGTQRWVSANGQVQFEGEGKSRQPIGFFGTALDITDQKHAEDEWRRSEQRLQLAQQAGRIGTWEWNLLTNDVSWSDGIWTLLGIEPGSITPNFESFVKFLHPDEQELILQRLEIALAQGGDYYDEFRVIRQDGTLCWLLSKGQVIRTQDGQAERVLGINVDITDRKQAEVALRNSAERLNLALAAAKLGDWSWDAQTDLVTFSERAAEFFGIPPGPYMTWTQMQTLLHEADRERARLQVEIAIAEHSDYDIEYRVIHADGTQRWVAAKGRTQFDATGQVLGMLGVVQDITERKQAEVALRQSEERLRLAMEGAQMGTWDVDLNTGKAIWSDQHFTMLGYEPTPTGEASEGIWYSRIHPEDRERVAQEWQQSRQEHRLYRAEYRVVRADTQQIAWLAALGSFVYNPEGEAVRSIGVLFDISDRKQAELEIRKFVSLADKSTEFIGICDMNFVPFYVNESGRQMVGLDDTRQYSETPVREFFFPEDQDFIVKEFLPRVLHEGRAEVEIRFRHFKTGEALWMIYNVFYITGENDQPIGLATVSRNITDRKRVEIALQESESRFRKIADHSPIMIWMSAPDGAGVWFNQQWCEFTGQTQEEALGSGWLAAVHPEDAQSIETTCLQAHQRHEPVRLEYRLQRQDGEYRWVFDSAVARFDDTGAYLGYIGSIIDISDRKQAEAEVQRREREFRAVVENTPDLIIRYDHEHRHLYVNPRIERALGIPPEQFIGRTAIELGFTDATSQAWNAVLQQVFITAQDTTFEFEFPNPEGDRRSYQAYFVPELVHDGEVKTVLAVVRDVTEYKRTQEALRQSEERYRSALQAGRMMTWSWDAKTDIIVRSETACNVIGLRREALQEEGSQGWRLVHPDDLAQHQSKVQAAIDSKGSYISEYRMIRPDNGRVIWIEDRGKVNVDAAGYLISIDGTLFDISDRKQAQQ
ncbi:MAG TPA: PAS domain S-box protein, partial [Coleofasciculaceae cyanobacterium]